MEEIIDNVVTKIKMHPVITIVLAAAILYAIYILANRSNRPTNQAQAVAPLNTAPPQNVSQTFNSYPISSKFPSKGKKTTVVPPPSNTGSGSQTPTPAPVAKMPTTVSARYVTVTPWPSQDSTLWGIAQANGMSLTTVEALNPQIRDYNLIYPGQQIRIS